MGNINNQYNTKVDVTQNVDFSKKMEVNKQGELVYMTGIKKTLCSFWLGRKIVNALFSQSRLETVAKKMIELCELQITKINNEDKPNNSKVTFDQENSVDPIKEFEGISTNISSLLNKMVKRNKDIHSETYKACVEIQKSIQKPYIELITAKAVFLNEIKNKGVQNPIVDISNDANLTLEISKEERLHNAQHVMSLVIGTDEAPAKGSYVIKYNDNCDHCTAHKNAKK